VSAVLNPATTPPPLPGIRRMVIVGAIALTMVVLAIAASLFELRHDRDVRHQYENSLMVTHLAFDAESLASRMRTWQDLGAVPAAPGAGAPVPGVAPNPPPSLAANTPPSAVPSPALRDALRAVDIDLGEWKRRIADAMQREFSAETKAQLIHLDEAVTSMRQALRWPSEILEAAVSAPSAPPRPGANVHDDTDRAYLVAVEAAQATLLASGRAGGEKIVVGRYTESELSAAVVIGASLAALLMGAVLASMLHRAQHENRAAIGVMGELLRTDPLTGITNRRGQGPLQARHDSAHGGHARSGLLQAVQQPARARGRRLAVARSLPGLAQAVAPDRHAGALWRRGIHLGAAQLRRRAGRSADRPPAAAHARQPDVLGGYRHLGL
jgi:hypothetical protein